MSQPGRSDVWLLSGAVCAAMLLPWAASAHLSRRVHRDIEPALTELLGEQVFIGGVEAGLTGELSARHVRVGRSVRVARVEASVALSSLLSGRLDADEIRVADPHLMVRMDESGDSNLARLLERATRSRRRGVATGRPARQRRIVVTGGDLVIDLNGWARVTLAGVAVHRHAGGLRVVAGKTSVALSRDDWSIAGHVDRAAADLTLPSLQVARLLAVGGAGEIHTRGTEPVSLYGVSLARGITEHALLIHGRIREPGAASGEPDEPEIIAQLSTRPGGGLVARLMGRHVPLRPLMPLLPRGLDLARARGRGHIQVTARGPRVELDADAAVDDLVVQDRRVHHEPVQVTGRARVSAALVAEPDGGRRVQVERFVFTSGALTAEVSATASYAPGHASWLPDSARAQVLVPKTSCAGALASLPETVRDRLLGLDMTGTMTARAELDYARSAPEATRLDLDVDISGCRVMREARDADPAMLTAPYEHTFPNGRRAVVGPGQPGYVALSALPAHVTGAFIAAEDGRFYRHRGFDPRQIERSLAINLRDRAFVRGGSTITQQLVKNAFLSHRRTLSRKLQEAVLTWRVEETLKKTDILERYLNIIELGPDVFGVQAAARHWFAKDAARLTVAEAAFLAALTRAPRTMTRRILLRGGLDPETETRVAAVLRAMRRDRVITEAAYRRALAARLPLRPDLLAAN